VKQSLRVYRTESDAGVAWLVVEDEARPRSLGWLWLAGLATIPLVLLGWLTAYAASLVVLALVLVVSIALAGPHTRHGARLVFGHRELRWALIGGLQPVPTSALDGEEFDPVSVAWDDVQRIDVESGRIALWRADGARLLLPWFPPNTSVEVLDRLRAHHAAFEASATPRADAEAAQRRLAALRSNSDS
jgi:hypothetical protein